jgi:ribonuclease D
VRGLSAGWKENEIGRRLMQVLASAAPLTEAELPPKAARGAPLGKEGALVADLLKLLLKIRSREIDVASRLLARSDDLELLAAGVRKNLAILEGWRFEQFGREALELVEGKLAFAVVRGKLRMTHIDDMHDAMLERTEAMSAAANEDDDDMPNFEAAEPHGLGEEPETELE